MTTNDSSGTAAALLRLFNASLSRAHTEMGSRRMCPDNTSAESSMREVPGRVCRAVEGVLECVLMVLQTIRRKRTCKDRISHGFHGLIAVGDVNPASLLALLRACTSVRLFSSTLQCNVSVCALSCSSYNIIRAVTMPTLKPTRVFFLSSPLPPLRINVCMYLEQCRVPHMVAMVS